MSVPRKGGKKEEFIDGLLSARAFILCPATICPVQNTFGDIWSTAKKSLEFSTVQNVHRDILF